MTNKKLVKKSVNKITWENWNTKEQEHLQEKKSNKGSGKFGNFIVSEEYEDGDEDGVMMGDFGLNNNIVTPFGVFPTSSMLKPTNRWDCWVAHSNFSITHGMANVINKSVEGVAALNILDRYTFVVGVPRQFDCGAVMRNIEKAIIK